MKHVFRRYCDIQGFFWPLFFQFFFLHYLVPHLLLGAPAIKAIPNKIYESGTRQNAHNGKLLCHHVFRFESWSEWISWLHSTNETKWAYICFQFHTNIFRHFSFFRYLRPVSNALLVNYNFMIRKYHFRYVALFIIIAAKEKHPRKKKPNEIYMLKKGNRAQ